MHSLQNRSTDLIISIPAGILTVIIVLKYIPWFSRPCLYVECIKAQCHALPLYCITSIVHPCGLSAVIYLCMHASNMQLYMHVCIAGAHLHFCASTLADN